MQYNCVAGSFVLEASLREKTRRITVLLMCSSSWEAHSITVSPAKGRVGWSLNAALSVTEAPQRRRERAMELEEWAEGNAGLHVSLST